MQLVFKYLENAQEEENVRNQAIKSGSNVQYEKQINLKLQKCSTPNQRKRSIDNLNQINF